MTPVEWSGKKRHQSLKGATVRLLSPRAGLSVVRRGEADLIDED